MLRLKPVYAGILFAALLQSGLPGLAPGLRAQSPSIKVDGKESGLVYLQKLQVSVNINGTEAITTWTMTFRNKTSRILEGELNFPLGQGVSISRYALDISGHLREAVPVEKQKATQVFESVERRRVDPGILEKVEGNSFRTRIYPIPANGTRTVVIGYEEELPWTGSAALRYRLPLAFGKPLEEFRIDIRVLGDPVKPVFDENPEEQLSFEEWQNSWSASHDWKDFKADHSISIQMPKAPGTQEALMQQSGNHYYYVVNTFPEQKKLAKKLPGRITILWDASLSGLSRNTDKELRLLDGYFKKVDNAEVSLGYFSNMVSEPKEFKIDHGRWDELRTALKNTVYDGATQFGALDLRRYPGDEFLLVSDGKSSFGSDAIQTGDRPVYAVVSSAAADFPFLQYITRRSGGELLNLENTELPQALDQLLYQSLHFLGVKASGGLEENYPSLTEPVLGSLSVAGISYQPKAKLVLQFGYGNRVVNEQEVDLDYSRQRTDQMDLARIWARKKLAELDTRYEDNKAEIGRLGRRFGIVTRNTSLIVLENVMDYVTYEIEPPAELRADFDRIMKGREQSLGQTRQRTNEEAEKYFDELLGWWKAEVKVPEKLPKQEDLVRNAGPVSMRRDTISYEADSSRIDGDGSRGILRSPAIYGLSAGTQPATVPPPAGQMLQGRAAGVQVGNGTAGGPGSSAKNRSRGDLEEVVVVGYGVSRKAELTYSTTTISPGTGDPADPRTQGSSGIHGDPGTDPGTDAGSFTSLKAEVHTDYLARIKAAAPEKQYSMYLELRKEHLTTPLFYFHMADFFFAAGEKAVALRILSNIAELDAESYELYKLLGYKLKEWGRPEEACAVFRKVLEWRPFEPQSYRDYGLALEDAGKYQQALDTLYTAMVKNYGAEISGLYPGIEETIVPEINNLIALRTDKLDFSRIPRSLVENMPVDIRVVLNWNMSATDIDLWVTDPEGEKCYYAHRTTALGGRISHDFTRGLGPEQFMLKKAMKGSYKVEVNYYGDSQVKLAGPTTVMVEVYTNYGTPAQKRQIMTMQMLPGSQGAVAVGEFEFR